MRIALTLVLALVLTGGADMALAQTPADSSLATAPAIEPVQPQNPQYKILTPAPTPSVAAQILSAGDIALYRKIFAYERAREGAEADKLLDQVSDSSLASHAKAVGLLHARNVKLADLTAWLAKNRDLAIADDIYRLAVSHSTKKVRRHHKTITVAVVTNIPAPSTVGARSGGYEDAELAPQMPASETARAVMPKILDAIKDGVPDTALALLQGLQTSITPPADIAIISHRIAASYLAEGMDAQAFQLAAGANGTLDPVLDWDAGFAAYRLGKFDDAVQHLEKLAESGTVQGSLRARAAFWAARAHIRAGDPSKVVSLLAAAAKEEPSFYGLIAERLLGTDTRTGFSDPVLSQADFETLMAAPAAHRAVALWQIGETEYLGSELNRAFVENKPTLDPAMAALAQRLGVTNIELRASEKSVDQGLLLTGLFPVPSYEPQGGYRIDRALVLAVARLESRFQSVATSPVGARGIMQMMPATANHLGGKGAAQKLDDPSYSLALGQRYIAELLGQLDGNILELGGAYNAGPQSVSRWLQTKAGKDDPLLFVESIPVEETRYYVRHLMEYDWLYRRRMGEDAKTLDDTARGFWPIYHPEDATSANASSANAEF